PTTRPGTATTRSSYCWRPGPAPWMWPPARSPPNSATSSATAAAWSLPPASSRSASSGPVRTGGAVSRAEHRVVVGGGFIGAEVAASATQMDTRVTLLEVNDTLWTRAVGSELGRFLEAFLRDRGVHVRTRTRAERLEG